MSTAELHRWARPTVVEGLRINGLFGEPVTVAQAVQGIGWLESRYATGWSGAGKGSNNWGCIQDSRPPCREMAFIYTDTHPNADGTSTPYSVCFRKYATPAEGCSDLIKVALLRRPRVLAAAQRGDLYGVSAELHASRYYEGFGATVTERIRNHNRALTNAVASIAVALQEPLWGHNAPHAPTPWEDEFLPDNPMVLRGSRGSYVKVWQAILSAAHPLGIAVDGMFGPITHRLTVNWQLSHGLVGDGKVGPKTWAAAAKEPTR